jgi:hypothetical protein
MWIANGSTFPNVAFYILNISDPRYPFFVSYWLATQALMCIFMMVAGRIGRQLSAWWRRVKGPLCMFMMWRVSLLPTVRIMKVHSALLSSYMMRDVGFRMRLTICYSQSWWKLQSWINCVLSGEELKNGTVTTFENSYLLMSYPVPIQQYTFSQFLSGDTIPLIQFNTVLELSTFFVQYPFIVGLQQSAGTLTNHFVIGMFWFDLNKIHHISYFVSFPV